MSNSTMNMKNETPLVTVPSRPSLRLAPVPVIAAFAVFLLAVTTLPARAVLITASEAGGVFGSYTAVDTNGTLVVTFPNVTAFVTKINNTLVLPFLSTTFAQLTLSPTLLTDDIPGLSGHFTPNLNSTQYGIPSLTPPAAPNVVFDYTITFGQAIANGLTLTGAIALDPASALTFTQGATTYDFSPFQNFGSFTLSLGAQDPNNSIYDVLKSGNGTFSGTGQFDQQVTGSTVPDTGSTLPLLGLASLGLVALRRKLRC